MSLIHLRTTTAAQEQNHTICISTDSKYKKKRIFNYKLNYLPRYYYYNYCFFLYMIFFIDIVRHFI